MTTTVRIINDGPDDIVIKQINPETGAISRQEVIAPGRVTRGYDYYVYDNQAYQIEELKKSNPRHPDYTPPPAANT